MEKTELVCITCPRGCLLTVSQDDGEWQVEGNYCARGIDYGVAEVTDPQRVLTCLMNVEGLDKPVSVKTEGTVPKALLKECAKEIYRTPAKAPICAGDVLIEDLCGTGCRVVATRDAR